MQLIVDTGSPVTIINKSTWERLGKPQLQPADIHIVSYTDDDIRLPGCVKVHVKCNKCCVALTQLVLCRVYATGSRPTAITMTRDKPSYKVCDCICNRAAFFVLYERSLQKNDTAIGDEDGPSPTTTTPSTSASSLSRTSRGTTHPMGKLVCSVGQFFYIDQFDASTEQPAQRPSKKMLI